MTSSNLACASSGRDRSLTPRADHPPRPDAVRPRHRRRDGRVHAASLAADGVDLPLQVGPSRLLRMQHMSDGRPTDGVFLAREGDTLLGFAEMFLPWEENSDAAMPRGHVHPAHRRRGVGTALLEACLDLARSEGRTRVSGGGFTTSPGPSFLRSRGWTTDGMARMAIRRLDLHGASASTWQALHDEAATCAGDYELVRLVGPAPDDRLEDLVAVHEAINDAPVEDPDNEPDVWTADRVRRLDAAMAARRQTTYRVLARHRATGAWAGMSLLCVDEFSPRRRRSRRTPTWSAPTAGTGSGC